tara:strand:+ start:5705 stop:8074 length:2370 start_codon:yes stop_codon:yes gene_type:complete
MNIEKSRHSDFELEQYVHEVFHEVNALAYSDENGASKEDKFTEYIMEILAEAGETEGVRLCPYTKENRFENIDLKINGYAIEDGFESVDLFITNYKDSNTIYSLKKPDFDGLLKWSTKFLNAALKGYLDDIEPSTEAYGLARLITKYRAEFIRVNIFIISNGNIPFDAPKISIKGFDDLQINIHIWDLERLHRLSQSKYHREPIEIDFKETLGISIPCLEMPSKNELYECYLAIIPGHVLATLYKNYGTRLLESNVRAFLQQTGKVNKGIRDTIRHEPYMFLPYNNGLATTAMNVKIDYLDDGQKVITSVKDFQIVNGGQTTASLYHTFKKFKADLSEVFVPMKLTVIKDEEKKNAIVPFISRFANSQTKVSELDLTSNNAYLIKLEELSSTTYAIDPEDRNKQTVWFFERVQGQYREALNKEPTAGKQKAFKLKFPTSQKILKSEVAKYMNIYHRLPYHVSKGAQKNYNYYLTEAEKEFKKKKPTRVMWEDIVANALLFKATDKLFGRKNQEPIGDTNIKSHTVAYTLSLLHEFTNGKIDLGKIWNQQFIEEELEIELKKGLIFVYEFFTSLNVLLISEAAKAEKTWNQLVDLKKNPFDLQIIKKYCISEADFKKRYESGEDDVTEIKKYNDLQRITELGIRFWDGLNLYMHKTDVLSVYQQNLASTIRGKLRRNGNFTEHDILKGIEILNVLLTNNVDFTEVSKLSKLAESNTVNPSAIYNRLSILEKADWDKIIALGDQTGTLSFNDISVIKTVIQQLKRKENIDLKRLIIVDTAINKLKKFGIKK